MCLFPEENQQPVLGVTVFQIRVTIFIRRETKTHILPTKINEKIAKVSLSNNNYSFRIINRHWVSSCFRLIDMVRPVLGRGWHARYYAAAGAWVQTVQYSVWTFTGPVLGQGSRARFVQRQVWRFVRHFRQDSHH